VAGFLGGGLFLTISLISNKKCYLKKKKKKLRKEKEQTFEQFSNCILLLSSSFFQPTQGVK